MAPSLPCQPVSYLCPIKGPPSLRASLCSARRTLGRLTGQFNDYPRHASAYTLALQTQLPDITEVPENFLKKGTFFINFTLVMILQRVLKIYSETSHCLLLPQNPVLKDEVKL